MKKSLKIILRFLARKILDKYQPEIIGITGSVGKTSTKEAVAAVLSDFNFQKSEGNYNNEIGLPLTIIGAKSAGKNIFGWIAVFLRAKRLILFKDKNYPKILLLEMAADKPGDLKYLLDFVKPKIGILTRVGPVHLEKFGTQEKILEEKSRLIRALPKNGFAILNFDYKEVAALAGETKAQVLTYGMEDGADVRAKNILFGRGQIAFTVDYKEKSTHFILLHAMGKPQIYAALAGICCGLAKGMKLEEIKKNLSEYVPPKGRGTILKGIKNTIIIDETYNASPQSMEAALENLKNFVGKGRSIAVLGDMLELGSITEEAHLAVGQKVKELGIGHLYIVGARAKNIARGAQRAGMKKDKIYSFNNNQELGIFLQEKLEEGDTVLVKGSRGMKMEEIIQEIKQ